MTGKHKANTGGGGGEKNEGLQHLTQSEERKEMGGPTNEHVPDAEQEVHREEGDSVEREGLQGARAGRQVEDPNHHAAQAEVDWPAVHDDPIMALLMTERTITQH